MKIPKLKRQEKLFFELLDMDGDLSPEIIDKYIKKLTNPRLVSIAEWLRDCLVHMESI